MNDIRRTILWVIFGFSMVMLWDNYQVSIGQKAHFWAELKTAVAATATAAAEPAPLQPMQAFPRK